MWHPTLLLLRKLSDHRGNLLATLRPKGERELHRVAVARPFARDGSVKEHRIRPAPAPELRNVGDRSIQPPLRPQQRDG